MKLLFTIGMVDAGNFSSGLPQKRRKFLTHVSRGTFVSRLQHPCNLNDENTRGEASNAGFGVIYRAIVRACNLTNFRTGARGDSRDADKFPFEILQAG